MASKGLGTLPRRRYSALSRGCGTGVAVVLPLARAAAVSTGLRIHPSGAWATLFIRSQVRCFGKRPRRTVGARC